MRNKLGKIRFLLLSLASAILIYLSYPKSSIYPLAFISLVPYIRGIFSLNSKKEAIKYGFTTGFFVYLFILYWIYPTLRHGDVNAFLSALAVVILSAILSVEFIIITVFGYLAKDLGNNMLALMLPSIWVCLDWLKTEITRYIIYFPWFEIAYSQWNNKLLLPLASFGQSYAITFIIVLINTLLTLSLVEKEKNTKIKRLIVALAILIASHIAGRFISEKIKGYLTKTPPTIKVAILQPSIDLYIKWDSAYIDFIKSRIEALIKKVSLEKPDIIIWPENALYGWIDDEEVFSWLCRTIKESNTYHIVGSVSKGNAKNVSLYLISPQCKILGEYHKRILVPFGEYVPIRGFLSRYISVIGSLGEFEKGDMNQKPLDFKGMIMEPSICYETIFKHLFYPEQDTNLIINITNDGWYLNTSAPYQHLAGAVFRAVENRRVFVRAANNGVSAVILPDGRIKDKLELNQYGFIVQSVPILKIPKQSSFEKYWACIISAMVVSAFLLSLPLKR